MEIKSTDLVSLFEKSLQGVSDQKLEQTGIVVRVGDGVCVVHGLTNAMYGELVEFEHGNRGIIMQLDEDEVAIFLMYGNIPVAELEVAKRTGNVFKTGVGDALLGRTISAMGVPVDGMGDIQVSDYHPIEASIPGIVERTPISESLETGIISIDALIPIGKGQRELIIGNRSTGKTSVAIDTILHQKGKNVVCVYVAIGQRQASVARIVRLLAEQGALEYTVVVSSEAGEAVLNQYLAPYVGCTIGEYFSNQGRDVLVVYDDLSNHAVAFREISLLLRRAPGREAYPGDVFYLHSRLLERAGRWAKGGSLTALPIVQIQHDDISAYIPTNLISITDGQIVLDTKLFNQGVRPAVSPELSISRVGGAAQTKAIKRVTRALRLELAQYRELLDFAQFGTELDEVSRHRLERGARIVELLKQPEHVTYSYVGQALMLFLSHERFFDAIEVKQVNEFATQFYSYMQSIHPGIIEEIEREADIKPDVYEQLMKVAKEFAAMFGSDDGPPANKTAV